MARKMLMIFTVVIFVMLSLTVIYLRFQPLTHISTAQAENNTYFSQLTQK